MDFQPRAPQRGLRSGSTDRVERLPSSRDMGMGAGGGGGRAENGVTVTAVGWRGEYGNEEVERLIESCPEPSVRMSQVQLLRDAVEARRSHGACSRLSWK